MSASPKPRRSRAPSSRNAITKALTHLDNAEKLMDELEAMSVFATVAADVNRRTGTDTNGLYGTDWEPLAKVFMRRIMEIVVNPLALELSEAREALLRREPVT